MSAYVEVPPEDEPEAHRTSCHCADCIPCRHHPGVDCGCYCRFVGCSPTTCAPLEAVGDP
jgi:hypothetical protein